LSIHCGTQASKASLPRRFQEPEFSGQETGKERQA